MPLPELPVNIEDPTHDTQREGAQDNPPEGTFQTHRGKKSSNVPHTDAPSGGARYREV